MRASRNFYPQQAKALLITFHPIPNNATHNASSTPSPTPTEPVVVDAEPPVFNALKRRVRKSKEIIEAMFSDSAQAGNLVKMLKAGSKSLLDLFRAPHDVRLGRHRRAEAEAHAGERHADGGLGHGVDSKVVDPHLLADLAPRALLLFRSMAPLRLLVLPRALLANVEGRRDDQPGGAVRVVDG
eukprot:1541301-Prymnesium_polylepis.1